MSAPSDILNTVYSLAWLLAIIFALWVAGRMILRNISLIQENKMPFERLLFLMIWLALGGLFSIPLLDFIGIVDALIETFVPLFNMPLSQFVTLSGTEPWPLFTGMRFALFLLVYGLALWLGLKVLRNGNFPSDGSIRVTPFEKIFLVLAFGGLAYRAVNTVAGLVISSGATALSLRFGSQLAGTGLSWMFALLLLGLILLVMLNRLDARLEKDNL